MAIIERRARESETKEQWYHALLRALAWMARMLWIVTTHLYRFLHKHLVTRTTRNVGIFGDVATGKTVFLTMLLHELQSTADGSWEFAPDKHKRVHDYVVDNYDTYLSKGEWPPGTPKGAWRELGFTLFHSDDRTRLKIECSDFSGEDLRNLVQEAQSSGTTVSEHAERLNAFFRGCDHYLFLINGEKLEYADQAIVDGRADDNVRYKDKAQRLYQDVVDWLEVLNDNEREINRTATVVFTAADQASLEKYIGSTQLRGAASKFSQKHLAQSHKRLVRYFQDVEFTGVSSVGAVKRGGDGDPVPSIFERRHKINIASEFLDDADSLRTCVKKERKKKRIAQAVIGGALVLGLSLGIIGAVINSRRLARLREAGTALVRGDYLQSKGDLAGSRAEYARARPLLNEWVEGSESQALPKRVKSPTGGDLVLVDDAHATTGRGDAFYAGEMEVTRTEFMSYLRSTGRRAPREFLELDDYSPDAKSPVVFVSWKEATAFCSWLTERARAQTATRSLRDADLPMLNDLSVRCVNLSDESEFRLPTIEEWRRLGGASDGRAYPWGSSQRAGGLANLSGSSDRYRHTAPVGSFTSGASPFGCHDVIGNVWEWCLDKQGAILDTDIGSRYYRAVCGGGWNNSPDSVTLSTTKKVAERVRTGVIGFRYVLAPVRGE